MGLIAKDTGGGDFTPVEAGTHLAVCNMVIDLGLQNTTYLGKPDVKHQCYVRWEMPSERITWKDDHGEHEGPMVIGRTYTVSLAPKANLRKDLEAWRNKPFTDEELAGFDLFNLLGHPCQVIVAHKPKEGGGVYVNVAGVAGWPKGVARPKAERPLISYGDNEHSQYGELPEWLRKKISEAVAPAEAGENGPASANDYGSASAELDDEIPF